MGNLRLFHVSENPGIKEFVPQPVPPDASGIDGDAVWAVDETHLPNYLLPRDCPRVTFRLVRTTAQADREQFFSSTIATHVIAIEAAWLPTITKTKIYLYEFPSEFFSPLDAAAGYYVSRIAVRPNLVIEFPDSISAIRDRKVELRVLPNLWALRDAIVASTLEFSIIRLRNAQPRPYLSR
jgi:hypothetical protein